MEKLYVIRIDNAEHAINVQRKLFNLGYKWWGGETYEMPMEAGYCIAISNPKSEEKRMLGGGNVEVYLKYSKYSLISSEDFLYSSIVAEIFKIE